jgi:hypothetical protein
MLARCASGATAEQPTDACIAAAVLQPDFRNKMDEARACARALPRLDDILRGIMSEEPIAFREELD